MKTKEFKQWCGFNGYIVDDTKTLLSVKGSYGVFLTISEICVNTISTGFGLQLDEELFEKSVEYAKTPIEERKEDTYHHLIPVFISSQLNNKPSIPKCVADWIEKTKEKYSAEDDLIYYLVVDYCDGALKEEAHRYYEQHSETFYRAILDGEYEVVE